MVFLRAYYVVSESIHRKVFVSMVKIGREKTVELFQDLSLVSFCCTQIKPCRAGFLYFHRWCLVYADCGITGCCSQKYWVKQLLLVSQV